MWTWHQSTLWCWEKVELRSLLTQHGFNLSHFVTDCHALVHRLHLMNGARRKVQEALGTFVGGLIRLQGESSYFHYFGHFLSTSWWSPCNWLPLVSLKFRVLLSKVGYNLLSTYIIASSDTWWCLWFLYLFTILRHNNNVLSHVLIDDSLTLAHKLRSSWGCIHAPTFLSTTTSFVSQCFIVLIIVGCRILRTRVGLHFRDDRGGNPG